MSYFAYGVIANRATLIRCADHDTALHIRNKLKMSDCRLVGSTRTRVTDEAMSAACRDRGWIVETLRDAE